MHVTPNSAVGVKYDCYQDAELDKCINTDYTNLEPSHTFHKHRESEDFLFPPVVPQGVVPEQVLTKFERGTSNFTNNLQAF